MQRSFSFVALICLLGDVTAGFCGMSWSGGIGQELCPAPYYGQDYNNYLDQLRNYMNSARSKTGFTGDQYSKIPWTQTNIVHAQVHPYDRYIYDRESHQYTVAKYVNYTRSRFGGVDSILFWPTYTQIGVDDRNQYDLHRVLPGGMKGLQKVIEEFHSLGVKVLLPYNPWDYLSRDERVSDAEALDSLISMIYDKDLEGARRDLKMAKELQHAETRDLDEVRVVEMILILFEGDFEYLEEFEILALQIDSPRWSVEIARRFPRICIYGRIVLARLLLLAKLYEWAHFELKELLQLQTISGIEKKFRLFPELIEGLHELWKLIPVEKQEKYEFVLEEGFSMTMPNIFSSLASTPMSNSILPNYKRQLSKFALAEQLVDTRMHLHSS